MPHLCGVTLASALLLAPAPPLTEVQQRDLAAARDDSEYREQAFFALVQSVRAWQPDSMHDDEPIRLAPDFAAMLKEPAEFRGDLCRITGELVQHTPLQTPYEDMIEWFVRDERGRMPVIVYVVRSEGDPTFHDRQRVQIDGRFYKRMRFAARDGRVREYPAFVGRFPIALQTVAVPAIGGRGLDLLAVLGGPVVLLVVVLVGVRAWASRKGRANADRQREGRAAWLDVSATSAVDDGASLPDDPAEALAELRRRAEQPATDHARDQSQSPA